MLKEIPRGTGDWTTPHNENIRELNDTMPAIEIANRLYEGVNLIEKFAAEITAAPFNGNPWAWIRARIRAQNWKGLNVGDFIPFVASGNRYLAEIAGMNTYKRQGDAVAGNPHALVSDHIDFITRDCHPDPFVFNRVNFNNGTTVSANPFLASDIHARLNNLNTQVPNSAAATPAMIAAGYAATGILNTLPADLRAVMVPKRALVPTRFLTGQLLIDDTSWAWNDLGLLWLPFEFEVFGATHFATRTIGHSTGGFLQYPIFAHRMDKIVKGAGDGGPRTIWWLASAGGGNSTSVALVSGNGRATTSSATISPIRVPLCFRVS